MAYKILIVDFDNTLIDFDIMERKSLEQAFECNGISFTERMINDYARINEKMWENFEKGILDKATLKVERFKVLFDKYKVDVSPIKCSEDYLTFMPDNIYFIDGAKELLDYIKDDYTTVLMTNGIAQVQRKKIKNADIGHYFGHIIISDEVGCAKPSREIYEHMANLIGSFDKSQVLAIGDSLGSDIKGGRDYGVDTVWFNRKGKKIISGATYDVQKLSDIVEILKGNDSK